MVGPAGDTGLGPGVDRAGPGEGAGQAGQAAGTGRAGPEEGTGPAGPGEGTGRAGPGEGTGWAGPGGDAAKRLWRSDMDHRGLGDPTSEKWPAGKRLCPELSEFKTGNQGMLKCEGGVRKGDGLASFCFRIQS